MRHATRVPEGRPPITVPSARFLPIVGVLVASCLVLAAPPGAEAQYFGQNQVRWDRFDFQILDTDNFSIYHYPEAEDAVRDAARMAERWYERLARAFTYELPERNPLILYADHPDFQQTNVIQGRLGEGTGGVTEGLRQRVVMPLTESNADTDHVLGHELVHVFQFSIANRGPGIGSLLRQPLWSVEGLAEYLSIGRADPLTAMWLRDAILQDEFPSIQDMSRDPQRYFPYRFGHAFWAYVAGEWGDELAMRMFRTSLQEGIAGAIGTTLGVGRDTLGVRWEQSVRAAYEPLLEGRTLPEELGRPVVTPERAGGRLNLAPSVSPDGELVAFFSERGVFSIDLWLAEVETGRVVRRLASTETDPHFDAIAFVQSAGSWSPDGARFAYVVFARGENRLVTVDAATGRDRREYAIPGVGAMNHPAWSPDGGRIVLTGMSGGRSDLWLVDLETGEPERLTSDAYSAIQPAWSPDGRTLAFVTERGPQTNLNELDFGPLRLALMDVASGELELVAPFPSGKAIDPAFSPDGRSLYFVADPDGFSDVYRMDTETRAVYRVTRAATGISGLSERSSALSVASREGSLAFSVFVGGSYAIHTLSAEESVGERVVPAQVAQDPPGALPPVQQVAEGVVMAGLRDATIGLPPRPVEPARPYRARLGLEFIGPVTIGVGADQFGAVAGGSVSFLFGDMLGHRNLQLAVQAQGELQDIGGQLLYLNQEGRWTWGGIVGRIPYRTGFTQLAPGPGGSTLVSQVIQRVAQHQAMGLAYYPFSRVFRAELMAGASYYTYSAERWTWTVLGGRATDLVREPAPEFEPPSITLYQGAAALVGDNAVMGFISPVRGERWRLEAQGTVGTLDFVSGLADYRRYFGGRPITLATRGLHLGRYGPDAEDARLSPLFLGFESLVRGYSIGSFRPAECTPDPGGGCPEFDRLVGSRIAVLNAELRLPVLGVEGYGLVAGGPFPLELGVFADAGVAWDSEESPELTWERRSTDRIPVASAGVTTRLGLGQFLALEVFYAYPFQRPERGAHFGFQIAPGW
jgi:hypothetical protein